jgi:hypothetical protein
MQRRERLFKARWPSSFTYTNVHSSAPLAASKVSRERRDGGYLCCGSETIFFGSGSHFPPSFGSGSGSYLTSKKFRIQFRIRP